MGERDRIAEFSILYEIASMPTRLLGLLPIGEAVVDKATRLLSTDLAILYLSAPEKRSFEPSASRGVRLNRVEALSVSSGSDDPLWEVQNGKVLVWSQTQHSKGLPPPLSVNYPVQDALYIPIGRGDNLLGIIYVARLTHRPFTEDELSFFTLLADKTATAVENYLLVDETRRQLEELKKQRSRLEISNQVGQQITSILNLDDLLTQVVRSIQLQFDYNHVSVWLPSEDDQMMVAYAMVDRGQEARLRSGEYIPFNSAASSIVGVYQSGAYALIQDVNANPQQAALETMPNTRAEITLPLRIGHKIIGVLDIHSDQANAFDPQDTALLQTLANQIGVAVRNAQLYREAQEARQEAEEANKTKTRFLANMSHELRTPLNVILNFTEFVADGFFGEINEKQESALRNVLASSEHLLTLINEVLDLTKIEAGMMVLFMEKVDLNAILAAVISMGKGLVKEKPIQLEVNVGHLPATYGDNRRLRQVFLNILSNAVKFTKNGKVTLTASFDEPANEIEVSVSDTGIGIAQEDWDKVFESFKQAKHDLTGTVGTGLGMPISKYFVEMHGGKIWFESTIGVGTTFYVRLPLLSQDQAEQYTQSVTPQDALNQAGS